MDKHDHALIEDTLGDAIRIELRVPSGNPRPESATFTLSPISLTHEGPFDTEAVSQDDVRNVAALFIENFVAVMGNKGYRLNPGMAEDTAVFAHEEFPVEGRTNDQLTRDFQEGIRLTKQAIATARFGKRGQGQGEDRTV